MKRPRRLSLVLLAPPMCLITLACTGSSDGHSTSQAGQGGAPATTPQAGQGGPPATSGANSAGGSAGGGGGSAGGGPMLDSLLVDDFEDGDDRPLIPGEWYGYVDTDSGGLSTLSFTGAAAGVVAMNGAGFQSQKSLEVSYTFDKGTSKIDPYAGFGVAIGTDAVPYDLASYTGVSYTYQGGAHRVQVQVTDVTDYDDFGMNLPASPAWKTVNVPFQAFAQDGWGVKAQFDLGHVKNIAFALKGLAGTSGGLKVDNLVLTR